MFEHPGLLDAGQAGTYDVSPDGRFLVVEDAPEADTPPPSIKIVENWYEEFRDRK